jgi:hypothetical protein
MANPPIDFSKVKRNVAIEHVLERYGVALKKSGRQFAGCCPIHGGSNPRAFVVSPEKNAWRCFADYNRGGSVIDLVAELEDVSPLEAAQRLIDWFDLNIGRQAFAERRLPVANNRPSHKAYVIEGEGEKAFWTRIGSAWPNSDGKGFNITLSALPINGRIVLREYTEEDAEEEAKPKAKQKGK